jgi:hypothetical protein
VQKNLLASKLKTRPNSDWPRATKPNLLLYKVVTCQLYKITKAVSNIQSYNTVKPKLDYTIARS